MAEKPKSFDEFYSKSKDDIYDIDIVVDYAETHNGDIGDFSNDMFCPECQKAKLIFVHKTSKRRAHLRRNRSTCHEENCSYNFEYASKRVIKEYVDSLNRDEIQDKLNSMMYMLCRNKRNTESIHKDFHNVSEKSQNPMLITNRLDNKNILKALRRKRLNGWIDESDGENLCVLYGEVKLRVVEKDKINETPEDSYKYNLLYIYTKNKKGEWKFRTSLYRGNSKDVVNEELIYNIVMIGHLDFKFKPFTIKLANKNAILYHEYLTL